jgi:hypothetical protein
MFRGLAVYALPRFLRYLDETRESNQPHESRVAVMLLVAETADRRELKKLFEYLDDPEPVVRAMAAAAIHRITRDDGGASKELWLEGDAQERRSRIERWRARVLR